MVNFVNSIELKRTYVDTLYSLGYDRDNYEISMAFSYPDIVTGYSTLVEWSEGAIWTGVIDQWNLKCTKNSFGANSSRRSPFEIPLIINESYTQENEQRKYASNITWDIGQHPNPYVNVKYGDRHDRLRKWGKLMIGSEENTDIYTLGEITLKVNNVLVMDLKPCLDGSGIECFYDTIRRMYIYPHGNEPSDSMIKTVVLTGERQELPINDGIDVSKIANRATPNDKIVDGYAAKYDSICITAGEYNGCPVLVSDYTEDMQENTEYRKDYVTLLPRGRIELPRDRQIQALNRPLVKGNAGDIVKVAVR